MPRNSVNIPQRTTATGWPARLLLLLLVAVSATGCVRRRLTIRSNPPGAMVYVDNQQVGTTPCSVDFTYYGTREIRLVKSGFETLTVNQPIPTPWYQVPPLDFVSDNLPLQKIRDNRTVSFDLQPQMMLPVEEIIRRGETLRQQAQAGPPAPAPGGPEPRPAGGEVASPAPVSEGDRGSPSLAPPGGFAPPPNPLGAPY